MEEVVEEIMQVDKVIKLFQTMAIVSLNMGNLNLEVNNLKNRLATRGRRRQYYRRNWIRKEIFKKGISIMWKSGGRIG